MHVLETRATSDCFSSYTAQSTRPTVRPLFTSWSVAVILRGHSIFVTAFLLSPRAGPDGRGYGQPKHDQGGGHGGENAPQPPAEPVARDPTSRRGHE